MRLVLLGDGESPHLLKWARALAPQVELWAASSRGFSAGWAALVPPERRLALATRPAFEGGNLALLRQLPRLARWLRTVRADWIHAHYLTSHGTLAWLATAALRVPGRLVGSAWGSDILVTPQHSRLLRWVTGRVLRACALTTSDSQAMAQQMHSLGAAEVMVFPFGLEALPLLPAAGSKRAHSFFANRGLEPIYAPQRVLQSFAAVAHAWPDAALVVANDGALRPLLERQAADLGIAKQVQFVGRLDTLAQARCYAQARWYLSLPESDSVSVSVLEAMAHGCIPILSDLPANRELVRSGDNGLLLAGASPPDANALAALLTRAEGIARTNHAWVAGQAMFAPAVAGFLARLRAIDAAAAD
jgi:glycosyltransferase involved in cell wall biosynthesis